MKCLTQKALLIVAASLASFAVLAEDDLAAREQAARQVAGAFLKELGGHLKAALQGNEPAEAIKICRDIAPAIANRLSLENGWMVTRVGTRVRNPMIGMPDTWEQRVLTQFQELATKDEPLDEMTLAEVVSEPDGRYFRFMKAIGVKPMCVMCHGDRKAIPEPVRAVLSEHYPHDQALGYQVGQLRGAVSIKQPLDIPLSSAK